MLSRSTPLIKAGLECLYFSRVYEVAKPSLAGLGAIFTLHHILPKAAARFQPNRILEITPGFLEAVIDHVRARGYDIVDLDEAVDRLQHPGRKGRFIVFTFDDGYRDVLDYAYPILKRQACPFTLYVPTSFPDGEGLLWWRALEHIIGTRDAVRIDVDGEPRLYILDSLEQRYKAYSEIYWWLRMCSEKQLRAFMVDLCARYQLDLRTLCVANAMTWSELAQLAQDPLVTLGAHTVDHVTLSKSTPDQLRMQIREGTQILETALGRKARHFSYPYGNVSAAGPREFAAAKDMGFTTAVTTRPGILYAGHAQHLHALPRVSLNGDYQSLRYIDVLLSGLPFYVWNGFQRLNVH